MKDLRDKIEKEFSIITDRKKIERIRVLKEKAEAYIDICELCVEEAALQYDRVKSIFVLYFPEDEILPKLPKEIAVMNLKKDKDLEKCVFLYGDEKEKRNEKLRIILEVIENSEKVIVIHFQANVWYEGVFNSSQHPRVFYDFSQRETYKTIGCVITHPVLAS